MTLAPLLIIAFTLMAVAWLASRTLLERDRWRAHAQREVAMHERLTAAPTADLAAAVEQLATATGALERAARERGPSRVGHRVTVHTGEHTLFGVVVGDYTDRVALEDAEYVVAQGRNQPLPGRQDIATADIAWIDVHAHVAAPAGAPTEG